LWKAGSLVVAAAAGKGLLKILRASGWQAAANSLGDDNREKSTAIPKGTITTEDRMRIKTEPSVTIGRAVAQDYEPNPDAGGTARVAAMSIALNGTLESPVTHMIQYNLEAEG
jgi:hypothetical protein